MISSISLIAYLYNNLPEASALLEVKLQVPLRILSRDNKLIAEFGEKRRKPIPIKNVPKKLIAAVVATEDHRFYQHRGVDLKGLARALVDVISSGRKSQGGSTITMQVARNYFLSRAKTYTRKINEILLAIKIERELSKDQILELYLNKIYLGKHSYGIAAAAQTYYGKDVNELSIAQMAMLAGLPKAPSQINPLNNKSAALKRRSHVLKKMHTNNYLTKAEYDKEAKKPLTAKYHGRKIELYAPYVADMVKKQVIEMFGQNVFTSGMEVYTTIDSKLQQYANDVTAKHAIAYTLRHKSNGVINNFAFTDDNELINKLKSITKKPKLNISYISSIDNTNKNIAVKTLDPNTQSLISDTYNWDAIKWAARAQKTKEEKNILSLLKEGDIVYTYKEGKYKFILGKAPTVNPSLVTLSPNDGAINAIVGGYDYVESNFNRATQAKRQPGSAFKPFLYAASLENGYTAAHIINDAPIVLENKAIADLWRPQNHNKKFYGETRLRSALAHSINLVSIKLLQEIGIEKAINVIKLFGFNDLPENLSLSLGTGSTTLLELTNAFIPFTNEGYMVKPYLITKIKDSKDNVIFVSTPHTRNPNKDQHQAKKIISKESSYIMHSMLNEATKNGTAKKISSLLQRSDLAGKTGSTNDYFDAWFIGYHTDLVTGTWFGFDSPKSLYEYGSSTALPLWIDFMRPVIKELPIKKVNPPNSIVTVKIDPKTGLLARPGQKDAIFEVFKQGSQPQRRSIDLEPKQENSEYKSKRYSYNTTLF